MKTSLPVIFLGTGILLALVSGCGDSDSSTPVAGLPDISTFETNPTDVFLVDISVIADGHPYKGATANEPHEGAHLHLNSDPPE